MAQTLIMMTMNGPIRVFGDGLRPSTVLGDCGYFTDKDFADWDDLSLDGNRQSGELYAGDLLKLGINPSVQHQTGLRKVRSVLRYEISRQRQTINALQTGMTEDPPEGTARLTIKKDPDHDLLSRALSVHAIIGPGGLNFRVRNGNGCFPPGMVVRVKDRIMAPF